jgi:outer membrane scaffolding protein for murein synthesis (MipA/OmpV family)
MISTKNPIRAACSSSAKDASVVSGGVGVALQEHSEQSDSATLALVKEQSVNEYVDESTGRPYFYNQRTHTTGWSASDVSRATTDNQFGLERQSSASERGAHNPMFRQSGISLDHLQTGLQAQHSQNSQI